MYGILGATLLMAAAMAVRPVQAQAAPIPPGTAWGLTVDRFSMDGSALPAGTFHVSILRPNRVTPEFSLSLFPEGLSEGVVVTNLDIGGALNVPMPGATLLLRGGVSGLFGFGRGGAAALPGLHYGASLLVKIHGKTGIRLDVVGRHYLALYDPTSALLTLGVGITALPAL